MANPNYPNYRVIVLDAVQAGGADWVLDNGVFSIGNPLTALCHYRDIVKSKITAPVAEQLQVTTLTPTAAANSVYEITIQQYNPNSGTYWTQSWSYTTAASGDDATSISTYFRTAVNAATAAGVLKIAATGTSTLILTALTGYAKFTVVINRTGGGFTQSTGTAGIAAVGTVAALALQGITVTAGPYTQVAIEYNPIGGYDNTDPNRLNSNVLILVNGADGDAAALVTKMRYTLDGREISVSGPANPEAISTL
jgi:hypothetical protein